MLSRFSAFWICLKFAAPDSLGRKIDTDVICHDDGNASLTIDNEIDEVCIGRAPSAEYHLAVFAVSDSAVGCYYHQERFLRPALDRVVAAIAQDFGLQFSYEFMYDECQSSIALNSMVNDRYNDSTPCYDAYVGLTCDNAYNPAAPIFKSWKVPIFAPFVRNKSYQNKNDTDSAYTVRTGLTSGIVTNFLAELFNYNNGLLENRGTPRWNNVTVIYAGKNTGKHGMPYDFQIASDCNMLLNAIRDITDKTNMTFYIEEPTLDVLKNETEQFLRKLHDKSRAQLWCVEPELFTEAMSEFVAIKEYAREFPDDWAIFYWDPYVSYVNDSFFLSKEPLLTSLVREAVKVISLKESKTSFRTSIVENCESTNDPNEKINMVAESYADAFYGYAQALDELGGNADPLEIVRYFAEAEINYKQTERKVVMNKNSDEQMDFNVFRAIDERWVLSLQTHSEVDTIAIDEKISLWRDGVPPSGNPKCGLDNSNCVGNTKLSKGAFAGIITAVGVVVIVAVGLGYFCYRRWTTNNASKKLVILIPEADIKLKPEMRDNRPTSTTNNSFYSGMRSFSRSSRNLSVSSLSSSFSSDFPISKSKSIVPGYYSDTFVALKRLTPEMENLSKSLNARITDELRHLVQLQHNHIAKIYGLYSCNVDGELRSSLVTEFGTKGSLKDLLEDKDTSKFNLTWEMKRCLMLDVIQGLSAIHRESAIGFHGNLKSQNCIVDGRLTVKLTDFALPSLLDPIRQSRREQKLKKEEEKTDDFYKELLWMAPEKLKLECPELLKSTSQMTYESIQIETRDKMKREQSADMYSFGIICQEIMYRKGLFWLGPDSEDPENLDFVSPQNIIRRMFRKNVTKAESQPFLDDIERPDRFSVEDADVFSVSPTLKAMVDGCWTKNPDERLKKSDSEQIIKGLVSKMQASSLVDSLMDRMEDYSCHLEDLVEERTIQYKKEKERADDLLYRMLPKCVADDMKNGRPIKPRQFDNATVFFSDIVNFAQITKCLESRPKEIVSMLDQLYTLFDSITERFKDIYKVETIGADYMVVSGLPEPLENPPPGYYAGEIAKFSLELMKNVKVELNKMDPDSDDVLWLKNLRIGFHSGSLVAGVVGQKMPRYCLFGDTVNTASRMKSNGKELKIHVSSEAHAELLQTNMFLLESRGKVHLKGRGEMDCYWLQEQLKTESYAGEYPQSSIMKLPVGGARKHARKQDRNTITEVNSTKRTSGNAMNSYGRQSGQTANNSRGNTGRSNFIETDDDVFETGKRRKTMPSVCFGESPQIIEIGDTRGKNFLGGLEAEPAPSFLTAKISASSKQSSGYYTSDGSRQNTAMGVSLNHGETFDSFDFGGRKSTFTRSTSDWRKTRATDEPKHIELIEEVPDLVPAVDVKYTQL